MPSDVRPGATSTESKQSRYCVIVIIVGAGLFMVGTSIGRNDYISVSLSILGSVLFLVGTFTLMLVLMGFTKIRTKKSQRAAAISVIESSESAYDPDAFYMACYSQPSAVNQTNRSLSIQESGRRETHVISLPTCPKVVVPVQVQPPPSYEEALAISKSEHSPNPTTSEEPQINTSAITSPQPRTSPLN